MEEINEGDLDLPLFDQLILDPRTHVNIEAEPLVLDSTNDFKLQATPTSKLLRFLHIGSEEDDLKVFNVARSIELPNVFETAAFELIKDGKGLEILSTLVNMVKGGHQYVEGAIPYVLAVCACSKVAKVKQEALNHVGTICNRPRMILEFVAYCEAISKSDNEKTGWGRSRKRAVQKWYGNKRSYDVAFAVTSCATVNKWNHRDVIRLCHLNPTNSLCLKVLCMYIARGYQATKNKFGDEITKSDEEDAVELMELLDAVNQIKQLSPTDDCCALVAKHKLNWGHIPCQLKNNQAIWKSILPTLGLRTLIQNLPRLHRIEILAKDNLWTKQVLQRLMKKEAILKSELHPYSFLLHQRIYSKGEKKDEDKWTPNLLITNALNAAFYTAIENVKATGKRICITIDCSNSMKGHIVNSQSLDCRTVAAAISLVMAKVETNVKIQGFSEKFVSIAVAPDDTVESLMEKLAGVSLGGTDCSRPMITAKVEDKKYDAFIIITDKDTYKGKTSPAEALIQYRAKTLIPAKFVLIALGVRKLTKTVATPNDRGMLAVCGFNESLPNILYNFLCDHF